MKSIVRTLIVKVGLPAALFALLFAALVVPATPAEAKVKAGPACSAKGWYLYDVKRKGKYVGKIYNNNNFTKFKFRVFQKGKPKRDYLVKTQVSRGFIGKWRTKAKTYRNGKRIICKTGRINHRDGVRYRIFAGRPGADPLYLKFTLPHPGSV